MESTNITLSRPDMNRTASLMISLANRKSVRSFQNKPLAIEDLSDLLWAANGINRPETNGHTASNALNEQEISVYVCTPDGVCLYCPAEHSLIPIIEKNLIPYMAGGQEYVLEAPVILLLVADYSVYTGSPVESIGAALGAMDAGIISQNIALFCSGNGLDTVARGTMDVVALKSALKMKESQQPLLNHPVGYSL